ncbi:MAG: hypothetical protein JEZ07_15860 [Phycisphaerae bacterium]|nr:hypothetical protein [Phycisphaerae bacterium]
MTRDDKSLDIWYYWYLDNEQKVVNPEGSNVSEEYYCLEEEIANAIVFDGSESIIDVFEKTETPATLSVPAMVKGNNDFRNKKSKNKIIYSRLYTGDLPEHKLKIKKGKERDILKGIGIDIAQDYKLDSKGLMMVSTYIPQTKGGHVREFEWIEGEKLVFTREINGKKIYDDNCIVVVNNNEVTGYGLTNTPVKKKMTRIIKEPRFEFIDSDISENDLKVDLIYKNENGIPQPYWQIIYGRYEFHYKVE